MAQHEEEQAEALARLFSDAEGPERERLARIVDMLPCYVTLIARDHRILFRNRTFDQYFGPPDGRPCYAAIRGQSAPCRFCAPLGNISHNSSSVTEWVHPGNNDAFRVYAYPFTDSDGTVCILKVGFSVTSRLRVQQALDLSEQSYRAITDSLSIGIALLDTQRRVTTANPQMSEWFGEAFGPERNICEILGCRDAAHAASADAANCLNCSIYATLSDANTHEQERAVTFQDGQERMVRLVACPVKSGKHPGKANVVRALIVMLEDITIRLRVNQQLQRARKLEAMNALAGGIAHEINQPLSALHLYASGLQLLMEKEAALPPETTQERLRLIMSEAEKIRSIINHMRALVMREGGVPLEPVDVALAVEQALALMGDRLASRNVRVTAEIPAGLPKARGNALQLQQVLVNLLTNALHALSAPRQDEGASPHIRISARLLEEEARVRLEVADNGPGLPKGSERIFDPFYTTKEQYQGMGLGLSIAHAMVNLWGGEIGALARHPELGGALFFIGLRVFEEEGEA